MMNLSIFKVLIVVMTLLLSINCSNAFENKTYITRPSIHSNTNLQGAVPSFPSISQQAHNNRPMKPPITSSGVKPPLSSSTGAPLPGIGNPSSVRPYYNPYIPSTIVVKDSQTGGVRYYPSSYSGYVPVSTRTTSFTSGNSSFTYTEQYVPFRNTFGTSGSTIIHFR